MGKQYTNIWYYLMLHTLGATEVQRQEARDDRNYKGGSSSVWVEGQGVPGGGLLKILNHTLNQALEY